MDLTPDQVTAANQGSIDAANKANVTAGLVSPTAVTSYGDGNSAFITPALADAQKTEATHAAAATTLAGSTGTSSTAPFISTSDSAQQNEAATSAKVNDLAANNQATTDAHNAYLGTIGQEKSDLELRRQAEVDSLNKDFDSQKNTLQDTQNRETGAETVLQQRAGGYLGMGASQTGALISLNQTHATEMSQLEAKRQTAITTAQNAITDKEFTLAEAAAKEAKDYAAEMQKNQQTYLDNKLKIQKSAEDAVASSQAAAEHSLKALSSLTPDMAAKIDPAQLTKIDQAYGVPGFAKNYIVAASATNAAKSQTDLVDARQKLLTLLQDIPQGQKVTFPDPANPSGPGTTYTGMGKVGDIATFNETDNHGNMTIIAYNKSTNTITRTPVGQVGKSKDSVDSGTRLGNMEQFMTDPKNKILVPADPSNPNAPKYMTADNYVAMYQKFTKVYPGQGDEFLKQWPIEQSVLPSQQKFASQKFAPNAQTDKTK